MKNILILMIILMSYPTLSAEIAVKQIGEQFFVSDGKTCLVWDKAWIPYSSVADSEWQTVDLAKTKYNWPIPTTEQAQLCKFPWVVKYNPYNKTDGSRPIRSIETDKYTGEYIKPGEPCGDRARPDKPIYYRTVPGGMTICEKK